MKNAKRILLLFLCLITAACATQTPIAVYITPTVQSTVDTVTGASASGYTLAGLQSVIVAQLHPTVTWVGSIVGSGYTPPPTATPQPTIPPPTVEGQPTSPPSTSGANFPDVLPNLDASRMGIQIEGNLDQADWDEAMRRVGPDQLALGWIKIQVPWKDMQPSGPNDVSTFFQQLSIYIEDAKVRHLRVLLSIAKAPGWARSTQEQDGPPDDPQAYANFITLMLNQLKGNVDAIEIWNEPNLSREWTGGLSLSGEGYMQLFAPAYQAIRAYSGSIQIVTAGLAPTGNNPGVVDDRTYLRQMYAAGLGNYRDIAIGVHPYSWANPPDSTCCGAAGWDNDPHFFFADTIRDTRQIMVTNGHSDLKLWVTEFGWPAWEGFPGQPPETDAWVLRPSKWDQANYTIRAFQIGQQTDYIGPMFLWNLNFAVLDGMVHNSDERAAYSIVIPGTAGVLDPNITVSGGEGLTERPLYWMIYDAVRPDVNLDKYD
ncbi:MAG: hypothetical protein IT319_20615 [Anaerolineae bacterium]|nr:hypothetical protein [Anaerolineae bacterium]